MNGLQRMQWPANTLDQMVDNTPRSFEQTIVQTFSKTFEANVLCNSAIAEGFNSRPKYIYVVMLQRVLMFRIHEYATDMIYNLKTPSSLLLHFQQFL